jgi:hypothetical protein
MFSNWFISKQEFTVGNRNGVQECHKMDGKEKLDHLPSLSSEYETTFDYIPAHILVPTPKGVSRYGWALARGAPFLSRSHRSGTNLSASSKCSSDKKCTLGHRSTWVPAGTWYPESTRSCCISLDTSVPTGYKLEQHKKTVSSFTVYKNLFTSLLRYLLVGDWKGEWKDDTKSWYCITTEL